MSRAKIVLIFIVLVLFVSASALATQIPNVAATRATLRGLSGIYVVVEELDSEVEDRGLSSRELQGAIEQQLRKANIQVVSQQQYFDSPEAALLYVNVNTIEAGFESFAVCIEVSIRQRVLLERDTALRALASTSVFDELVVIESARLTKYLRLAISEHLTRFIFAYTAANPAKPR